ncbi:MAG: hypothetical protein V1743_05040 [Nanoarchaeota archaeon]
MKRLYKKAQSSSGAKTVYYLFYGLFLLPITFLLIAATNYYSNSYLYIDEAAERELSAERVFTCFALQDKSITREYPVIDLNMMAEKQLDSCFASTRKGIRVVLEDVQTKADMVTLRNAAQDIPQKRTPYYVIYKDKEGNLRQGILHIELSP